MNFYQARSRRTTLATRPHRGGLYLARPSRLFLAACCLSLFTVVGNIQAQQPGHGLSLLPRTGNSGSTDELLLLDFVDGRSMKIDQARRDPLELRFEPLRTNIFQEIGRPAGQPGNPGEIHLLPIHQGDGSVRSALFVEASTGYTAYFDQVGRNRRFGKIITTIGRLFGPLASTDQNFVLLERREGSGRTVGAYLYHGTSGKLLYLAGLQDLQPDGRVMATNTVPGATGFISATDVLSDEETVSFLVVDSGVGSVTMLDLDAERPEIVSPRSTPMKLFDEFAADTLNPSIRRFVPVSIVDGDETTTSVLLIDVGSGKLGLIDRLSSATPRVSILSVNVYDVLPGGLDDQQRSWTAVAAKDSSGATRGAWIYDSKTAAVVYVERPDSPADTRVRRVSLTRR